MRITKERWQEAQTAERDQHKSDLQAGRDHYQKVYEYYFEYLQVATNLQGKSIMEIGPGDFPAIMYCHNYMLSYIIEPMPSAHLHTLLPSFKSVILIKKAFEEIKPYYEVDEIWLLNVMQHIIDPELFINRCKAMAKVIRFFEPINEPITVYHPHTYTKEDFERWFGEVKIYNGDMPDFHTATCAYGIYKTNA